MNQEACMLQIKKISLRLLSLALLVWGMVSACYAGQMLEISTSEARRPSTLISERILTQAYAQLDIQIHFVTVPVTRASAMWKLNQLDGTVRVADSELADSIKIKVPIAHEEVVVFTTKEKFQIHGFASLQPYVVGYVAGTPYVISRLKDLPFSETAPNRESLFRKLDAGRTQVALESRFSSCVVKKLGLNNIVILEPSLEKVVVFHFLHVRHQNLAVSLEKVLFSMEKDGTIKKIQDQVMSEFLEICP
jgi:polar amino acid transport system substrate-binding protein